MSLRIPNFEKIDSKFQFHFYEDQLQIAQGLGFSHISECYWVLKNIQKLNNRKIAKIFGPQSPNSIDYFFRKQKWANLKQIQKDQKSPTLLHCMCDLIELQKASEKSKDFESKQHFYAWAGQKFNLNPETIRIFLQEYNNRFYRTGSYSRIISWTGNCPGKTCKPTLGNSKPKTSHLESSAKSNDSEKSEMIRSIASRGDGA